mmetsp:Transcript_15564/g.26925  ORF Transcript_15564/g.26925 Transcript_15564/m.26925 type:complete len:89 (-) Transcript_15564:79-345(-)
MRICMGNDGLKTHAQEFLQDIRLTFVGVLSCPPRLLPLLVFPSLPLPLVCGLLLLIMDLTLPLLLKRPERAQVRFCASQLGLESHLKP